MPTERRRGRGYTSGLFLTSTFVLRGDFEDQRSSSISGTKGRHFSGKMKTQFQTGFPLMSPPEFGVVGSPCVKDRTDLTQKANFFRKGRGRSRSQEHFSAKRFVAG